MFFDRLFHKNKEPQDITVNVLSRPKMAEMAVML